jgi:hypothetical protein
MNPSDPEADAVWRHILPQIRHTRRKRKIRQIVGSAAAVCGLAFLLTHPLRESTESSVTRIKPAPKTIETIAVMRVDENGSIRLEEITSNELGCVEFAFGQTPVISAESAASVIFPDAFH